MEHVCGQQHRNGGPDAGVTTERRQGGERCGGTAKRASRSELARARLVAPTDAGRRTGTGQGGAASTATSSQTLTAQCPDDSEADAEDVADDLGIERLPGRRASGDCALKRETRDAREDAGDRGRGK